MNRSLIIAIGISMIIAITPHFSEAYSAFNNKGLVIPDKHQKKLIANQKKINDLSEAAQAAYKENREILADILAINGIDKKDDEEYVITLENGKWSLYKK